MHLEKNRTYACTFSVQRKEINVVKDRFTMSYSLRKLSNYKVMTTACNFRRQIACSFQVMSGNILFLGNKIFEIPPFFQARPGDLGKKVHACSLRFSALKNKNNCGVCENGEFVKVTPPSYSPYSWPAVARFVKPVREKETWRMTLKTLASETSLSLVFFSSIESLRAGYRLGNTKGHI